MLIPVLIPTNQEMFYFLAMFVENFSRFVEILYPVSIALQESGVLLSRPWPEDSDTTGKAVSLLCMQMFFGQFVVATSMGFLIQYSGTHQVTLLFSCGASCLAAITALHVTIPSNKKSSSLNIEF